MPRSAPPSTRGPRARRPSARGAPSPTASSTGRARPTATTSTRTRRRARRRRRATRRSCSCAGPSSSSARPTRRARATSGDGARRGRGGRRGGKRGSRGAPGRAPSCCAAPGGPRFVARGLCRRARCLSTRAPGARHEAVFDRSFAITIGAAGRATAAARGRERKPLRGLAEILNRMGAKPAVA